LTRPWKLAIEAWLAGAVVVLGLAATSRASAQTNQAIAEALFLQGKEAFVEGHFDEACPKLQQSYQADPAGGTVLLLAMCYERQGRIASAWATFSVALARAQRDGRTDREQRARESLQRLEPRLSYLILQFNPSTSSLKGLSLELDGSQIPSLAEAHVPIDPGAHVLHVHAPRYQAWVGRFEIGRESQTVTVEVPALEPEPTQPPAAPATPPPAPVREPRPAVASAPNRDRGSTGPARTIAWVMGGAGLAACAVGGYFGWRAIDRDNQADDRCPGSSCDDPQAVTLSQKARADARKANAFIGVGAATVVGAVVTYWIWGTGGESSLSADVRPVPGGAAAAVHARF